MKEVEQYNEWACAAGCLASFLMDIKKKEVDQKHDMVDVDYGKDLNPFCAKTSREGLLNWGWSHELHNAAKAKKMNPKDFKDEKILKDFLRLLDKDEVKLLEPVAVRALAPILKFHGLKIIGIDYLPEVLKSGELPSEETYLIVAFVIGETRDNHVLRWQGRCVNGALQVMDPKAGQICWYAQELFESGKCLFVRLGTNKLT